MKTIIFYYLKDMGYVQLRHPYLEMYKAADLRDLQVMKQRTMRSDLQRWVERKEKEYEAKPMLGDLIRHQMELNSSPLYVEATDPEDVAVLGYN